MQVDLVNMLKFRAFNAMDSFISAALAVLVPLSLASRGVSIVEIGGIVALLPLVFTVVRTLSASIADGIGTKPFFVLSAATNTAASFLYMNATTSTTYLSGKFLEGVKGGAIWAVNRLEMLGLTKERKVENEYSRLVAIRVLMYAVGTLAAGFIVLKLGFEGTFLLFAMISLVALALSLAIGSGSLRKEPIHLVLSRLDIRKKSRKMWDSAFVMLVGMPASTLPLSLLFPLYLNAIGFNYGEIGIALALYYFVAAATVPIALRLEKSFGRISLYCGVIYALGAFLLPFFSNIVYVPMIIMAVGDGLGSMVWEGIIAKGVKGNKNQATDVGIIHLPAHFVTAIMIALGGVIVSMFGFAAAFYVCGAFMFAYGMLGSRALD